MKAFVIENPRVGKVIDIDIPKIKNNEVLIKVGAVGLCGTDVNIFNGEYFGGYERVPGHEFSGVVTKIGSDITRFKIGDRVSADPNIFCEGCNSCKENNQNFCEHMEAVGVTKHGAFAEYVAVPENSVFEIGDLDFVTGALIEPLACVIYGQDKLKMNLGSKVLIIGAGPIGLMHLMVSKINGASEVVVTDLYEDKLVKAMELGADRVILSTNLDSDNNYNYFNAVIDCTGIPKVVENSVKYVKDSGTFLLFGVCPSDSKININPYEIFKREITITSTFALKKTFGRALALVKSKKVNLISVVDKQLTLEKAPEVFENASKTSTGLKVVFLPNN